MKAGPQKLESRGRLAGSSRKKEKIKIGIVLVPTYILTVEN